MEKKKRKIQPADYIYKISKISRNNYNDMGHCTWDINIMLYII